jgi:hypothetical protein
MDRFFGTKKVVEPKPEPKVEEKVVEAEFDLSEKSKQMEEKGN